jgi:hypothetical protein
VAAETCFLLKHSGFDPSLALQFIERGFGTYQESCPLGVLELRTSMQLTSI